MVSHADCLDGMRGLDADDGRAGDRRVCVGELRNFDAHLWRYADRSVFGLDDYARSVHGADHF